MLSLLLVVVGVSALKAPKVMGDAEILLDAKAKYGDQLPAWLMSNYTIDNLKALLTPAYLEITSEDKTEVYHVKLNNEIRTENVTDPDHKTSDGEKIDPATIWQIGKAIWELIADNTPTVNYTVDWSGAVPENVTNWEDLTGWQEYKSDIYTFEFKNFVHMKLSELQWVFTCQYGGQYNGVGQYLTLCGASIHQIYAYLSEHVDASAKGSKPFNYGTKTAPIGGLNLQVVMSSHGYFEKTTVGCTITMYGNGEDKVVQCDQN